MEEHFNSEYPTAFDPSLAEAPIRVIPVRDVYDLLPITHAPSRIEEYLEAMIRGNRFPPISVVRLAGTFVIADGHKRFSAYKLLAADHAGHIVVEVWSLRRWISDQRQQFLNNLEKNKQIVRSLRSDPATARRLLFATLGHWRRVILCLLCRAR